MAKVTVQYFKNLTSSAAVASTDIRLAPHNKLPISALRKHFNLASVLEIEKDGVAVVLGFDQHGLSYDEYTPNSTIKITGEPRVRSIVSNALPPLGDRELSSSSSKTRPKSTYDIRINITDSSFGILDEFSRDKLSDDYPSLLWTEAITGALEPWSGEDSIQKAVKCALIDCTKAARLGGNLRIHSETTFSISRLMAKHRDRVDVTAIVNDTKSIVGVCEVKLPSFNMNSVCEIVDYMVDLRNSLNVRFVFGILTTYEKWRILWFADTDAAAGETSKVKFDELCCAGSANDYYVSSSADVCMSPIFDHSDIALVETLATLMYKMSMTPIASPVRFIEQHKKYVLAKRDSFSYESLPKSLVSFSYLMPDALCKAFYILQYFHRGGDGRVALCCSENGNLCVLKFLISDEDEEDELMKEADLWNKLWGTKCRVVKVKQRHALLMPFCFHVRMIDSKPEFCGLQTWDRQTISQSPFSDVADFRFLDLIKLQLFQNEPMQAATEALTKMSENGVRHDDMKWAHVALLPMKKDSGILDLVPVLLDLTRVTPTSSVAWLEEVKAELAEELVK